MLALVSVAVFNGIGIRDTVEYSRPSRAQLIFRSCVEQAQHMRTSILQSSKSKMSSTTETDVGTQPAQRKVAGDVVLVTGGAGFLGGHIVRLLQEKGNNIAEVRVFDRRPCDTATGSDSTRSIPVTSVVGDIRDISDVRAACRGVDAIIHTAGLISVGTRPDYTGMEEVNVKGTANILQACVEQNVCRLVYTSTIDVVIGYDDIPGGDETLATPRKFLFPGYPDTKHRAERLVLASNGRKLAAGDGRCLRTLALRPNVMYGEGDPYYVTSALHGARDAGGVLTRVGDGSALFQQAYVGNMAWAHLVALNALGDQPVGGPTARPAALGSVRAHEVGGRAYFVTDDTPLMNSFDFMSPFLVSKGYRLSRYSVPYPVAYGALWAAEWILWLLSPLHKVNMATPLCSLVYVNRTIYFRRDLAESLLGYRPIFDWPTSRQRAMAYYKRIE